MQSITSHSIIQLYLYMEKSVASACFLQMKVIVFERAHRLALVLKISHWFIMFSWRSIYSLFILKLVSPMGSISAYETTKKEVCTVDSVTIGQSSKFHIDPSYLSFIRTGFSCGFMSHTSQDPYMRSKECFTLFHQITINFRF